MRWVLGVALTVGVAVTVVAIAQSAVDCRARGGKRIASGECVSQEAFR